MGRPIFPVALATSRRIVLDNWDRSEINLPFSRGAVVIGEPVRVPPQADDQTLETARATLENALNAATERAHAMADRATMSIAVWAATTEQAGARSLRLAAGYRIMDELEI